MAKITPVSDPDYENIEVKLNPYEVAESKVKIAEHSKAWEAHLKTHKDARLHVLNMPKKEEKEEKEEKADQLVSGWESQTAKGDISNTLLEETHETQHKAFNLGCNCGANFVMDPITHTLKEKNKDDKPESGYDVGNKDKDDETYNAPKQPQETYKRDDEPSDTYQSTGPSFDPKTGYIK